MVTFIVVTELIEYFTMIIILILIGFLFFIKEAYFLEKNKVMDWVIPWIFFRLHWTSSVWN